MAGILVIGDEPNMRKLISVHLRAEEHALVVVGTIREGLDALETQDFDVILTDQKLPDGEGLRILEALSQGESATALVVLTALSTWSLPLRRCAKVRFDFLTQPCAADNLKTVIARAAQYTLLRRGNVLLRNAVDSLEGDIEIRGKSTPISKVKGLIRRVGPTDATVLITGETGIAKELSRAVHRMSMRAGKPLMSVNCAAFP